MSYDLDSACFSKALPLRVRPYAYAILEAANALVSPFLLFGLGDRETFWGTARAYKEHTGDWSPRHWSMERIRLFPHVKIIERQGDKALVMPEDGLGWGRGLLQLDFAAEYAWLARSDWRDPEVNIRKGVEHLKTKFTFMGSTEPVIGVTDGKVVTISPQFARRWSLAAGTSPDPRPLIGGALEAASVAAYNAAKENVLRAIATSGLDAVDLCTTPSRPNQPGDYSTDVRSRAMALQAAYDNA